MGKVKIILIFAIALAGCRSPERMIEKALERSPEALSQYSDTITLMKYQVDSVMIERGDTVFWDKVVTVVRFDTIIPLRQIAIEQSKTRQEVRKSHRLSLALIKQEMNESKLQNKLDKLQARIDSRTDRVKVRHETKIVRAKSRWWMWILVGIVIALVGRIAFNLIFNNIIKLR
jgi:hypothetical protein